MRCRGPVRGLTPTLRPGPGSWRVRWGRKCCVSRGKILSNCPYQEPEKTWAAWCIMWVLTTGQQTLCDADQKYLEKLLWQMTEYQGLLLMSEPIETNIYSVYHWQLPGYWIYGHGKNLLCFKIMTRPPGAVRSGHWIIAAWKSVFVTCL